MLNTLLDIICACMPYNIERFFFDTFLIMFTWILLSLVLMGEPETLVVATVFQFVWVPRSDRMSWEEVSDPREASLTVSVCWR